MNSRLLTFFARTEPTTEPSDTRWLLGPSPAAAQLWLQIRRVAPLFRSALILGEPGTGTEFAARLLHDLSPAAHQPLLILSAAEAEAHFRAHPQQPVDGTIFVSELERLSPAAQNSLLYLLRRRNNRSPRVIVASTRSLRTLITANRFNPELAAALGAIQIMLPALRDRSEDIASLAHNALQLSAAARNLASPILSTSLLEAATSFSWPGNIDQLRHIFYWLMEHRGHEQELDADDFQSALAAVSQAGAAPAVTQASEPRLVRLDLVVQEHVRSVLSACHGNKFRAAEVLGISRSTLYRMLEQNTDSDFAIAV
jgi:DNA-binding NtrC family response regulator